MESITSGQTAKGSNLCNAVAASGINLDINNERIMLSRRKCHYVHFLNERMCHSHVLFSLNKT